MLTRDLIFNLLGGLGFFFFGMQIMSEGLKKIAGERLRKILHMATRIPVIGVIVGAAVTCLIQSSSATTVMVVGFVNAGLLSLKQAICVVMGANIGTTFTAWLVSSMSVFKVTAYAMPCVGIGFAVMKLGRTKRARFVGQVILGFGLLFIGLSFMKDAFDPLKDSDYVRNAFVALSHNPLMGVLVGVLCTVVLQSSSATIAIAQMLAFSGIISFPATIPIILGDNIGTTITAQLAAIGTNLNAKRTAMSHTLFNVFGVSYMMFFVYTGLFVKAVDFLMPGEITAKNIMVHIAIAHSLFNITNTAIFLPLAGFLEKASIFLVPRKKGMVELGPQYLEKHLLNTPPLAFEQARKEIVRMLELAGESVSRSVNCFITGDMALLKNISNLEDAVDSLQSEITNYLVELSQRGLEENESEELPVLIHSVNDIERIGDHSENITELVEKKIDERLSFSGEAMKEIREIWDEVNHMIGETKTALNNDDIETAGKVLEREGRINEMQEVFKKEHIKRLNTGKCDLKPGLLFINYIDNMEKIADHLTNIVQGVLGGMRWKGGSGHETADEDPVKKENEV